MHRLDPTCMSIRERMLSLDNNEGLLDRVVLEKQMKDREEQLMPIYHQVAIMFADLHDTPGRMQEKGCINVSGSIYIYNYIYCVLVKLKSVIFQLL